MRQLPKVRKDLKTNFKEDQIASEKLNYLYGGEGTGDGNDDGNEGGNGTLIP